MRGRPIPLSLPRRMVTDLMHFSAGVPSVPVQRRMNLGPVAAARAACPDRPPWTALFTKAYALVARDVPQLRRAYVKLPWPRLYEYPASVAAITVEREYGGEPAVFTARIGDPATKPLEAIARRIRMVMANPVGELQEFRRILRVAALPRPVRRAVWWFGLNLGRFRGRYFGTFAVSVYSALGAESLHPLCPLTTLLNYGVIGADGSVDVRVVYDHRVTDGAVIARALGKLEEVLNGPIVDELRVLANGPRSPLPVDRTGPIVRAAG